MKITIIAGLSGSGKTSVLQILSEEKYTILEAIDVKAIKPVIETLYEYNEKVNIALVLNFNNNQEFIDKCLEVEKLKMDKRFKISKFYLMADKKALLNRFRELRKVHPLVNQNNKLTIAEAIDEERLITKDFFLEANLVIDTTITSVADLRQNLIINLKDDHNFLVNISSFGFKYGVVQEADYVFDLRFLANPYYIDELKELTGLSDEVYQYVFNDDLSEEFYLKIFDLLMMAIEGIKKEGRLFVNISFGCTGGKHRSVVFARRLCNDLNNQYTVNIVHIESKRGNW